MPLPSATVTVDLTVPADRPFRLGVLSDTHRYSRPAAIPPEALARLGRCDAFLHCGDFLDARELRPLQERAPTFAITGNVDPADLGLGYPSALLLRIGPWRIGAIHDAGRSLAQRLRLAAAFPEPLDVLCFGHSHRPLAERHGRLVLLNPGSAVDPRGLPACSVATVELGVALDLHLLKVPADGAGHPG